MAEGIVSFEEAAKVLDYNPDTGVLTRKKASGPARQGDVLGYVDPSTGYAKGHVKGKLYYAHRLAWLLHYGKWPPHEIDHINGDKTDNRIENLRAVSHRDNCKNHPLRSDNTSGVCGVTWDRWSGKWVVRIWNQGGGKNLGRFADFDKAVAVRLEASEQYGYHENHGREAQA